MNEYFRLAAQTDHPAIVEMQMDVEPTTLEHHMNFVVHRRDLVAYHVLVKLEREKPQELIGAFCLLQRNSESIEISSVIVKKEYRGRGVGKRLLQRAISQIEALKFSEACLRTLTTNLTMQSVALKCGFQLASTDGITKEYSYAVDPNYHRRSPCPTFVPAP